MIVGVCKFTLDLFETQSLKEKRSVLASIKQKVMNTFKVFVAEVEALDDPSCATLGIALAGSDENFVRDLLNKITTYIEDREGLKISHDKVEVMTF